MKQGIGAILVGVFLVVALLLLSGFNRAKPRILVMHSSDRNSSTVQRLDEGIHIALDRNRLPVFVRWHYLGIDHFPVEDLRQDAAKIGARTIEQFDPDLVIAVDDEAQHYLMTRYGGHARPKVVFTAIDQEPAAYGYVGAGNVAGIVETLPLTAIRDTLLQARQGKPLRLAVIGSPGPTGQGQSRQVQAYDWAPHQVVSVDSPADFATWQTTIQAMDGKVDALLVLSCEGLTVSPLDARPVPPAGIVHWIEANAKPLPLGVSLSYVEMGGALSVAPSARVMGEEATNLALAWVKAGTAAPPVFGQSNHYSVGIRATPLQARQVVLPSIYIEAARLNRLYFP